MYECVFEGKEYSCGTEDKCNVCKIAYKQGEADAIHQKENADGCTGCGFESTEEWELPCSMCKRSHKDYWRPKRENNK